MGDSDIFVKRVEFEVKNNNNNNDPIDSKNALLLPIVDLQKSDDAEKSKKAQPPATCCGKFLFYLDKFGIKAAFSHIGLLLGLALYCYIGGVVSQCNPI